MNIATTIRPGSAPNSWSLYVNGAPAIVNESMTVCANVADYLRNHALAHSYSEAAEIGHAIETKLRELRS